MEHTLTAPIDGTVSELTVAADAQVAEGAKVMVIEPAQTQEYGGRARGRPPNFRQQ
jgi:multidrug efflux pump subunit AcrA (membrane-fusion protein)